MKPDLVAPAVRVTGPVDRTPLNNWCAAPNGVFCNQNIITQEGVTYGFSAGTSFAAPAVAGAAAVIRKWYNVTLHPTVNPSPAMTKAILINGARDLGGEPGIGPAQVLPANFSPPVEVIQHIHPTSGPSGYTNYQGWGMLNLTRLLDAATNHFSFDQGFSLSTNNTWATPPIVANGAVDTRFTLVWTDPMGSAGSPYNAINNLDLLVCNDFATICYYANRFDSSGHSEATPPFPSFSDAMNVVEEVIIPGGTFASGAPLFISVIAKSIMIGPQDFAVFTSNTH